MPWSSQARRRRTAPQAFDSLNNSLGVVTVEHDLHDRPGRLVQRQRLHTDGGREPHRHRHLLGQDVARDAERRLRQERGLRDQPHRLEHLRVRHRRDADPRRRRPLRQLGGSALTNTNTTNQTCLLNDSPDWGKPTAAGTYTGSLWVRADRAGAPLKLRLREYNTSGTLLGTRPVAGHAEHLMAAGHRHLHGHLARLDARPERVSRGRRRASRQLLLRRRRLRAPRRAARPHHGQPGERDDDRRVVPDLHRPGLRLREQLARRRDVRDDLLDRPERLLQRQRLHGHDPGAHTVTANDGGKTATASLTVKLGPLDHLVLSPAPRRSPRAARRLHRDRVRRGRQLARRRNRPTTFTIAPNGSCTGNTCTATVAGAHTVTGTGRRQDGRRLADGQPGQLDHLALSPASATITAGGAQTFSADGRDQYNNSLGT